MEKTVKQDPCLLDRRNRGCEWNSLDCWACGFHPDEDERRRSLPLVRAKGGNLLRKVVGNRG